jgi:hypothetical protein
MEFVGEEYLGEVDVVLREWTSANVISVVRG